MPDITQLIVALTIVVLTALLTVLGIEVFYILKDIRKLLDRATHVMNDAEEIAGHIKRPTQMVASLTQGADLFTKLFEAAKSHQAPQEQAVTKKEPVIVVEEAYERVTVRDDNKQQSPLLKETPMPSAQATAGRRFFRMPRRPVS